MYKSSQAGIAFKVEKKHQKIELYGLLGTGRNLKKIQILRA